jgi:hypothetical protein
VLSSKRASAQTVAAVQPNVPAVPKDFRQHYARYKVSRARAPGRGAFHDFVLAAYVTKPARKAGGNGFGRTARWRLGDPDTAVGRWYGEGGNTQNAMMRSLRT